MDGVRPGICILEDGKLCDDCCECYVCDPDPDKICDSCGTCPETADYSGVIMDGIIDGDREGASGGRPNHAGRTGGLNRDNRRFGLVPKES
ncbi:MAG: hypothetical protein M0Z41_18720 [Peptococcaceae bacterium]|nr:hypothetical protein [Peptococcaceae bacterium]